MKHLFVRQGEVNSKVSYGTKIIELCADLPGESGGERRARSVAVIPAAWAPGNVQRPTSNVHFDL
jgi:hypothetical protein